MPLTCCQRSSSPVMALNVLEMRRYGPQEEYGHEKQSRGEYNNATQARSPQYSPAPHPCCLAGDISRPGPLSADLMAVLARAACAWSVEAAVWAGGAPVRGYVYIDGRAHIGIHEPTSRRSSMFSQLASETVRMARRLTYR